MSVLLLSYLVRVKPLHGKLLNFIEIFNEVCILLGTYLLIMFTDFAPEPERNYNLGWLMVAVMALNFAVNWTCILYKVINHVYPIIK